MRLIDADDLKENHMYFDENYGISYAQEFDIDGCPTVDAVAVVRCKDCRYWDFNGLTSWCEAFERHGLTDNFYCSWGERRSE